MAIKGLNLKQVEIISKGEDKIMMIPQKEMVDALVAILERAAIRREFVELPTETRCIGKTTALIEFAKKHRFAVIVGHESTAIKLREVYKYVFIYSQNQVPLYHGISIDNKPARFVVDECVDHDKIKPIIDRDLVVTGYKLIR